MGREPPFPCGLDGARTLTDAHEATLTPCWGGRGWKEQSLTVHRSWEAGSRGSSHMKEEGGEGWGKKARDTDRDRRRRETETPCSPRAAAGPGWRDCDTQNWRKQPGKGWGPGCL